MANLQQAQRLLNKLRALKLFKNMEDPVLKSSQRLSISIDYESSYHAHKIFFDALAHGLQATGHRVGVITGIREKDVYTGEDMRAKILSELGFKPDFVHMWGQTETIGHGGLWKARKMDAEDTIVHFDANAISIKRFTPRNVIKIVTNDELKKLSVQPESQGMA